jgi:hypothetical protein
MPEILTLTVPVVPPSRTTYAVSSLLFDWRASVISIVVVGSDGVEVTAEYTGAQATALMTALNTANLSTASLQKRVLQKLVADGQLAPGTVSGSPQ